MTARVHHNAKISHARWTLEQAITDLDEQGKLWDVPTSLLEATERVQHARLALQSLQTGEPKP